jgi:cyclin B
MISTINQSCINNSKRKKNYNKDKDKDKAIIKKAENEIKKEKAEHRSIYELKSNNSQIKILENKKLNDENKENINNENIISKNENIINKETIINKEKDKEEKEIKDVTHDSKENNNKDNNQYKEIVETNKENKDKKAEKENRNNKTNSQENKLTKFNSENLEDDEVKIKYFDTSKVTNVQIPKDYLNIIYYNLLKEEEKGIIPMPDYTYLTRQTEINEKMRSILVDWLIDVHFKFGFTDETLFMTISIIDRYLTISQITRTNFQLLGITALMIACKHEEIDLPKIDDFIYITDNAYVKSEVVKMEEDVLSKLNFAFMYPSPIKFFEYLSFHFNFDKKHHMMGKYLMESFLLDVKNCKYKPSIISCACTYIVMKFFKMKNYQESYHKKFYNLEENKEKYSEHNIKECAKDICLYVDNINKTNYQACVKKYSKPEQENVAVIIMNN